MEDVRGVPRRAAGARSRSRRRPAGLNAAAPARIALADWAAAGDRFAHRGQPVFYRAGGTASAEALMLIHGFPTASWDWEALWPALALRWRLFAPDLIGFGLSAKPVDHPYSIADQADLCETLLREHDVAAYHVLAHDYGDTVAQELLARQGEPGSRPRLRSIVFLNGGLFPETHRPVFAQRLLLSPLGPLAARLVGRRRFAKNLHAIFGPDTPPDRDFIAGCWTLLETGNGRSVMPRLIRYIVERRQQRARWVGALQAAPVPLKLIDGVADPVSGAHMAARYRELVPDADVTLLPRIGHYPQVEAPEAVLAAYLDFRARVVE